MTTIATDILRAPRYLHDMYGIGVTEDSVREEVQKCTPQLAKFVHKYMDHGQMGQQKDKWVNLWYIITGFLLHDFRNQIF